MNQLELFIEKAKTDNELAEKINALEGAGFQDADVITLAAEYGFTVTAEDIKNKKSGELGEEELENVAGGGGFDTDSKCWFHPRGRSRVIDGNTWLECDGSCRILWEDCACRHTAFCVDKWHWVHSDKYLYLKEYSNHKKKNPGKSYHT